MSPIPAEIHKACRLAEKSFPDFAWIWDLVGQTGALDDCGLREWGNKLVEGVAKNAMTCETAVHSSPLDEKIFRSVRTLHLKQLVKGEDLDSLNNLELRARAEEQSKVDRKSELDDLRKDVLAQVKAELAAKTPKQDAKDTRAPGPRTSTSSTGSFVGDRK